MSDNSCFLTGLNSHQCKFKICVFWFQTPDLVAQCHIYCLFYYCTMYITPPVVSHYPCAMYCPVSPLHAMVMGAWTYRLSSLWSWWITCIMDLKEDMFFLKIIAILSNICEFCYRWDSKNLNLLSWNHLHDFVWWTIKLI